MKRLLCFLLGHADDVMHEDGAGAAWTTCSRCGALTGSHTWHGGKPWEEPRVVGVGDDYVHCALCGRDTSLAMLATHLETEHDIPRSAIADAPIIDRTEDEE